MEIFNLFFLIYFILFGFSSIGFLYSQNLPNNQNISQSLIVGFCLSIIFLNLLFYLLVIKIDTILIIFSIIFIFCFALSFKIKKNLFFQSLTKVFIITFVPFLFFLSLYFFYGEQFIVFRGNKWDWFGLVSSSFYLSTIDTNDYLNLLNNFNKEKFDNLQIAIKDYSPYHFNVYNWLDKIPTLSLILGTFLKINLTQPFVMAYFFKCLCFMILSVLIFDFLNQLKVTSSFLKNFLFTLVFTFSFWSVYILEADYTRMLVGFPIFIFLLSRLEIIFTDFSEKNYFLIGIYVMAISTLLLVYPEILFIYFILLFLTWIFKKELFFFIKKNYLKILLSILAIFILIIPTFDLNYHFILHQLKSTANENRWWTYFGAFTFGSDNPAINLEFSNYVKELIYSSPSQSTHDNLQLREIISIIHTSLVKFNYEDVYFNVIPSIFGYYFITNIEILKSVQYLNVTFLVLFSFYLVINFLKNLFFIFKYKNQSVNFLRYPLITFFILSIIFILQGKLWTEIKLYMYFFPILAFLILFNFKKNNGIKIRPNIILMLIMIIFPIYKFSTFNYGIGNYDSFPSIQNKKMKTENNWFFDYTKYNNCKNIKLNFDKFDYYNPDTIEGHFKSNYLSIYLVSKGYKFVNNQTLTLIKNDKNFLIDCNIKNL